MLKLQHNFPLSQVTTLGLGGQAKVFVEVKDKKELLEALSFAQEEKLPFLVIGGGSNLLISDEGVDKLIIKNSITGIEITNALTPDVRVKVKSGTILQDLVNFTINKGLAGLEKLTGIPGTVGGAIYGNAGAYGQTISDHLKEVTIINPSVILNSFQDLGSRNKFGMTIPKDQCQFGYRDSVFKKKQIVLFEVAFELTKGDITDLKRQALETIKAREIKYPPGIKCPGSFFKNLVAKDLTADELSGIPEEKIVYGKIPAGALLEDIGAKGMRQGQIEIAPYHANLFINQGGGKAEDFYKLAQDLSEKVKEKFGIKLEPEVQLINLPPL